MSNSFSGLYIAVSGLRAQQVGIDVTTHNVANANTPGFSRQRVQLETTPPLNVPGLVGGAGLGQIGTGVEAEAIQRLRDLFADLQYRGEAGTLAQAKTALETLEQVESVFDEPSESGIAAQLAAFFDAWQDLADDPSDPGARAVVVQQAAALAARFNRAAQQLGALRQHLNDRVALGVDEVNRLAAQVAELNEQIVWVENGGMRANDLRDRRDLLLDRLAELAQASATEQADGSVTVSLGTRALVQDDVVDPLAAVAGAGGMWEVRFASDNALATVSAGELRGLLDARDVQVPGYLARLDGVAAGLMAAVNGLHVAGYGQDGLTGRAFFVGAGAADMAVEAAIAADPGKLGAADAAGQSGNNAIALAIAQLRQAPSPTPDAAYAALITALGAETQGAKTRAESESAVAQLLERRRQSAAGVSLDEEAVNMLRYQRAYEAAARVITAIDEMLDKLINSTGVVGR